MCIVSVFEYVCLWLCGVCLCGVYCVHIWVCVSMAVWCVLCVCMVCIVSVFECVCLCRVYCVRIWVCVSMAVWCVSVWCVLCLYLSMCVYGCVVCIVSVFKCVCLWLCGVCLYGVYCVCIWVCVSMAVRCVLCPYLSVCVYGCVVCPCFFFVCEDLLIHKKLINLYWLEISIQRACNLTIEHTTCQWGTFPLLQLPPTLTVGVSNTLHTLKIFS